MPKGDGGLDWRSALAALGLAATPVAAEAQQQRVTGSAERGDDASAPATTIEQLGGNPFVSRDLPPAERRAEAVRRAPEAFALLTGAGFPTDLVDDAVALIQTPPNFRESRVRFMNPEQLGTNETFDGMVQGHNPSRLVTGTGRDQNPFVRLNTDAPGAATPRNEQERLGVDRWVLQGQGNTAHILSLVEWCMNWSYKQITLDTVAPTRARDEFDPCSEVQMSDMPEGTEGVMTHVVLVPAGELSPAEQQIMRTCLGRSVAEGDLSIFDCVDGRCNYQENAMALILQQIREDDPRTFARIRSGEIALRALRPFAYTADTTGSAHYWRPRQARPGDPEASRLTGVLGSWDIHCFTSAVGDRSFRSNALSLNELEDDGVTVRPAGTPINVSLTDPINQRVTTFYRITNAHGPGPGDDTVDARTEYRWGGTSMRREN